MGVSENDFEQELDAFRVNTETASQYFYAGQAIHFISNDESINKWLKWYNMFWGTNFFALRDAMFIALGRIFDKDGRTHNIHRLLEMAENNPNLFKTSSPRWHKNKDSVPNIYEPQLADWLRLCNHVCKWQMVYHLNYKSIRDQVLAHGDRIINPNKKIELFQKTSYIELEKLFAFLDAFYNSLWKLYYNGEKPIIRYRRHSLLQMLTSKSTDRKDLTAGELVALDAQNFFKSHTSRKRTKNI